MFGMNCVDSFHSILRNSNLWEVTELSNSRLGQRSDSVDLLSSVAYRAESAWASSGERARVSEFLAWPLVGLLPYCAVGSAIRLCPLHSGAPRAIYGVFLH